MDRLALKQVCQGVADGRVSFGQLDEHEAENLVRPCADIELLQLESVSAEGQRTGRLPTVVKLPLIERSQNGIWNAERLRIGCWCDVAIVTSLQVLEAERQRIGIALWKEI